MNKHTRILSLVLSFLLLLCLTAPARADAGSAEIISAGKTYTLTVSECRPFTRTMYMVVVKGYNMMADSDGDGITVDQEHLPFQVAIGSDLEHTTAWNGIQMTGDDTTPFVFPLEAGADEPVIVLIANKDDPWENGWVYDIAAQQMMTAAEWLSGGAAESPADPVAETADEAPDVPSATSVLSLPENVKAGDIITFSSWPQSLDGSDSTPVEWLVLDTQDDRALLLSRYALDFRSFHERDTAVSWEECDLRAWLNNDFLNKAFTPAEQEAVLTVSVNNSSDQAFDYRSVIDWAMGRGWYPLTRDRVFLLSYAEANKYLGVAWAENSNPLARAEATPYTAAAGAKIAETWQEDGIMSTDWWLRTRGTGKTDATCVNAYGALSKGSSSSRGVKGRSGVRPAFWLKLHDRENAELIGKTVSFGAWPQTAAGDDHTPIEWIILDSRDGALLLISRYGLDAGSYHEKYMRELPWAQCSLRARLNDEFLSAAFTPEEQAAIRLTEIDNSNSQNYYNEDGGENTQDKVFLLSYAEANRYFGLDNHENMASRAAPTAYAVAAGAFASETYLTETGEPAGYWWLRSPIHSGHNATNVNSDGDRVGWDDTPSSNRMIRPAIWVEQSAVIR